MKKIDKIIRKEKKWSNFQNSVEHRIFDEKIRMSTNEIKGAVYIGSVVITKSLTKFKPEESEIIIQLAINKVCRLIDQNCPVKNRPKCPTDKCSVKNCP